MIEPQATAPLFEAIFGHCARITSSIELNDVVKSTLAAVSELLDCDQAVITLVEDGVIKVLAADPPVSLEIMASGLAVGRGLVGRAVAERTVIYSPDIAVDATVIQQTRNRWDGDDRSVVAVPFALGDEVIGALHAISKRVDAFSEQHRARLVAIAPAVAVAVRRALTFDREREAWDHRRKLDEQKSTFMQLATEGLEQPLQEIADLVEELRFRSVENAGDIPQRLLDKATVLAQLIEEVLDISVKDSFEIELPTS